MRKLINEMDKNSEVADVVLQSPSEIAKKY
jgi:hypothetical protein